MFLENQKIVSGEPWVQLERSPGANSIYSSERSSAKPHLSRLPMSWPKRTGREQCWRSNSVPQV